MKLTRQHLLLDSLSSKYKVHWSENVITNFSIVYLLTYWYNGRPNKADFGTQKEHRSIHTLLISWYLNTQNMYACQCMCASVSACVFVYKRTRIYTHRIEVAFFFSSLTEWNRENQSNPFGTQVEVCFWPIFFKY